MSGWRILVLACCSVIQFVPNHVSAQGVQPYPNAITDRLVHGETPMAPPPVNTVFSDPDFGSLMVRATDTDSKPKLPGSFFRNPSEAANEWSVDNRKFYVAGENVTNLAYAFDPQMMKISSLPRANAGQGLRLPLRAGPTFSYVDPDLMYGTTPQAPLTISTYRFSTGVAMPLLDTTTCGAQPPLAPHVTSDDVTTSADDSRVEMSEGGKAFGAHMFVVVYDKQFGCRWYNTQTGQVGGQWGSSGQASVATSYFIRHSTISGSGRYVKIGVDYFGFYVWDIATLNVMSCPAHEGPQCAGYGALGHDTYINAAGSIDEMNTIKRPLGDLTDITSLVSLPLPHYWGMEKHYAWSNGRVDDSAPVCGNTYSYDGDTAITQPYDGEIFCMRTDGIASTVWRFGHSRAIWNSIYFYTLPQGNISLDGHFLIFTSGWDNQVGTGRNGGPRTDVWIVKLQ